MFGIDIARYQAGLDLVRAKAEGVAFVIVKSVASYLPGLTVAEEYQNNIDRTVAAGLPKGHYAIPNGANDPEQTAVFMAENLHQYSGGDVLALDNEVLDVYGTFWQAADCARFFRRLHAELGHPYERMWLYYPANQTRLNRPWTEVEELGVKAWWSAYGSYPTGQTPDHLPSLQGSLSAWHVHQFTSRALVAGQSVDGNYSPHTVAELFGGVDVGYLEARPAKGNMNQGFGPRLKPTPTSPAIHYGQDYGWGGGDAIYAARGGRVKSYGSSGAYGNRLVIDHGDGTETWYCHLSSATVSAGQWVSAGQQVAWMGATGNVTAKHLHFELRINGVATDPEPYFAGSSPSGGGTKPIEEDDMFTDQDRANLQSVLLALGAGGLKPGGWKDSDTVAAAIWAVRGRVENIDRQVTGADGFAPSVASRVIAIQDNGVQATVDLDALAEKIAAKIPGANVAAIASAVREAFRAEPLT